jgi:RNA polymerase sigma-70 factor (ECF subfamily)
MNTTPASLLERLRQPADQPAWDRFVRLYTPLLFYWARRQGLQDSDAADLVQDVLTHLFRKLPEFTYEPGKSFRGWLRTVLVNQWHDRYQRRHRPEAAVSDAGLAEVAGPDPIAELDEAEYRQHLVSRALQLLQTDFEPATWKAFWEYFVLDRPAAEVARELATTTNVVYLARSRVLGRLRLELAGLLD